MFWGAPYILSLIIDYLPLPSCDISFWVIKPEFLFFWLLWLFSSYSVFDTSLIVVMEGVIKYAWLLCGLNDTCRHHIVPFTQLPFLLLLCWWPWNKKLTLENKGTPRGIPSSQFMHYFSVLFQMSKFKYIRGHGAQTANVINMFVCWSCECLSVHLLSSTTDPCLLNTEVTWDHRDTKICHMYLNVHLCAINKNKMCNKPCWKSQIYVNVHML